MEQTVFLAYRGGTVGGVDQILGWDAAGIMPDGSPMPIAISPTHVWQGQLGGRCGLSTVSFIHGQVVSPAPWRHDGHGYAVYDAFALVWHPGEVPGRDGSIWFMLADRPPAVYPSSWPAQTTDSRLRSSCLDGGYPRFDVVMDYGDICRQSPRRCAQPPRRTGLLPSGLIMRLYGESAGSHHESYECRLNGQPVALRREQQHGYSGHDECYELAATYLGTINDCENTGADYYVTVSLIRRAWPEFRSIERFEVEIEIAGRDQHGTWTAARRELIIDDIAGLWGEPVQLSGTVYGMPLSFVTLEPVDDPVPALWTLESGLFCAPYWPPPCPRPPRLVVDLVIERIYWNWTPTPATDGCSVVGWNPQLTWIYDPNLGRSRLGWATTCQVIAITTQQSWELDVLDGCCAYAGVWLPQFAVPDGGGCCGRDFYRKLWIWWPYEWGGNLDPHEVCERCFDSEDCRVQWLQQLAPPGPVVVSWGPAGVLRTQLDFAPGETRIELVSYDLALPSQRQYEFDLTGSATLTFPDIQVYYSGGYGPYPLRATGRIRLRTI